MCNDFKIKNYTGKVQGKGTLVGTIFNTDLSVYVKKSIGKTTLKILYK